MFGLLRPSQSLPFQPHTQSKAFGWRSWISQYLSLQVQRNRPAPIRPFLLVALRSRCPVAKIDSHRSSPGDNSPGNSLYLRPRTSADTYPPHIEVTVTNAASAFSMIAALTSTPEAMTQDFWTSSTTSPEMPTATRCPLQRDLY